MGYHVLINYKSNDAAAKKVLQEIENQGNTGEISQFDVSDKDATKAVLENWSDQHKDEYIEVVVNNAGIRKDNMMVFMEGDEWQQILDIHLGGFYNVTQPLLKKMIRNRYGRIINIVSVSGLRGVPGQVNYSAAKAGIIGASKSLAMEVARRKITVNCVAPGFIQTDMTADLDEAELKKLVPMRRFGNPQEVANVVAFLASEKASYITGEVISVTGGL